MIRKLIKRMDFNREEFPRIDLSGGLRLNIQRQRLELPTQVTSAAPFSLTRPYSLAQNLTARTWTTNPKALRRWILFQVERRIDPPYSNPNIEGTPVTIRFRLSDGVVDRWWDGAEWSPVVTDDDWNSEAEVADHVQDFPVATRKLAVVVNMYTLDQNVTPYVLAVKLLYEADFEEEWSIVYESLLPAIKQLARSRGRVAYRLPIDANSISFVDLKALGFDTSYNIVDVVAAYNHTDDPDHLIDIRVSYDSGSKLLTLSEELEAEKVVYVDFLFEPVVVVNTTRDYYEIAALPSVAVTQLTFVDMLPQSEGSEDSVHHPITGEGWRVPGPREFDVQAVIEITADKQYDGSNISSAIRRWIGEVVLLTMAGSDERYQMISEGEREDTSTPGEDDIREYRIPITILRVAAFDLEAEPSMRPSKIVFTGGNLAFTVSKE